MQSPLDPIQPQKKSGEEPFHISGSETDFNVSDFWRWSNSDFFSNTARGILAEFIVACALDIPTEEQIRDDWAAFDLMTTDGIKLEVKSAAYVQAWKQKKKSRIDFKVPKVKAWNRETGEYEQTPDRHADVYVFTLLEKQELPIDPLDLSQWKFYAIAAKCLKDRKTISLSVLKKMASSASWDGLGDAVRKEAS